MWTPVRRRSFRPRGQCEAQLWKTLYIAVLRSGTLRRHQRIEAQLLGHLNRLAKLRQTLQWIDLAYKLAGKVNRAAWMGMHLSIGPAHPGTGMGN